MNGDLYPKRTEFTNKSELGGRPLPTDDLEQWEQAIC